jgi:sodium transport system permease protein
MWVVFSKEFLDIIRDRRRFVLTLLSMFVFFPLLVILPYAFMFARAATQRVEVIRIPVQGIEHAPALISYLNEKDIQPFAADDVNALVKSKKYAVGLIIPADYATKIENRHSAQLVIVTDKRRTMNLTSDRLMDTIQDYGVELMQARLDERGMSEDFFTPITVKEKNAATTTETAGSLMGLFIPGFIIAVSLTAGMPIATSAIAGEKKKLTLEPMLFTPVGRFQLVFAKLLAVMTGTVVTLLSMGISFLMMGAGIVFLVARKLPLAKIASSAAENAANSSTSSALTGGYHIGPLAIFLFFFAPFLIILLSSAFQTLISTWARNDEEATTYLMPLSFSSVGIFTLAFLLDDFIPQMWHYSIPVFGTILSMRDLLSNKVDPASLLVMFATSTLYALLMIALAVWMFHREEVVFRT